MKEHREHRRLVREAATMSDDDYEHAGPVDKTDEEVAEAQRQRQAWQDQMHSLKSELSTSCSISADLYVRKRTAAFS